MKKIILSPNVMRDGDFTLTRRLSELLKSEGYDTVVCPLFDRGIAQKLPVDITTSEMSEELKSAYMLITLGGDGTILKAARISAGTGVPILGVNLGDKGFMAELEADDIDLIPSAITGNYRISRRMMLNVEHNRGGDCLFRDFALNDAVIRGTTRVVDLTLYGDGEVISRFSGDGAVIATPVGSTAYSMSAGGPIVEPSANNIIITPICAHALVARSFVLDPERRVTVEIGTKKVNPVFLSVDGGDYIDLRPGDTVNICRSTVETMLVHFPGRSFYKKVSEKLGERA
ncbi:MAG: NAD(+)/NADH kinase [Oscillospiraceae bacterium]|nr:NAD(+)/NADH kinase [Oscillospiraceae bacterium]